MWGIVIVLQKKVRNGWMLGYFILNFLMLNIVKYLNLVKKRKVVFFVLFELNLNGYLKFECISEVY